MAAEGVTRFSFERVPTSVRSDPVLRELTSERVQLVLRDAIGCNMARYGACYGNLSARVGEFAAPPGRREFIVSGTQTGRLTSPGLQDWVRVTRYDHARNWVSAEGGCDPSSESMTHAAIYDADLAIRAVVHGHDRQTWLWLQSQGAPTTPKNVDYGTPEMAAAASTIVRERRAAAWRIPGVFAMAGHEDGVVAWGDSVSQATTRFVTAYDAARIR